jgi:hypothetical protein
VHIFHTAVRFAEGGSFPAVAILTARPQLVDRIVNGYTQQEVALNFGAMLRDCVHYAELSRCERGGEGSEREDGFDGEGDTVGSTDRETVRGRVRGTERATVREAPTLLGVLLARLELNFGAMLRDCVHYAELGRCVRGKEHAHAALALSLSPFGCARRIAAVRRALPPSAGWCCTRLRFTTFSAGWRRRSLRWRRTRSPRSRYGEFTSAPASACRQERGKSG